MWLSIHLYPFAPHSREVWPALPDFRFLLGAGESANWPAATKAVSEWFPKTERGLATALFDSGSSIGGAVAPFLIGLYPVSGLLPAPSPQPRPPKMRDLSGVRQALSLLVRCAFAQYQLIFAARLLRRVRQSFKVSVPTPCLCIRAHPKNQLFSNHFCLPETFQLAPHPFAAHNCRQIRRVPDAQMGFAESLIPPPPGLTLRSQDLKLKASSRQF